MIESIFFKRVPVELASALHLVMDGKGYRLEDSEGGICGFLISRTILEEEASSGSGPSFNLLHSIGNAKWVLADAEGRVEGDSVQVGSLFNALVVSIGHVPVRDSIFSMAGFELRGEGGAITGWLVRPGDIKRASEEVAADDAWTKLMLDIASRHQCNWLLFEKKAAELIGARTFNWYQS